MPFNTLTVGAAVAPTAVATTLNHVSSLLGRGWKTYLKYITPAHKHTSTTTVNTTAAASSDSNPVTSDSSDSETPTTTDYLPYALGLTLIRRFLVSASHHTVEDLQRFTAQRVPHPVWVRIEDIAIPGEFLDASAALLDAAGVEGKWWRWRGGNEDEPEREMLAEEIEMRADKRRRDAKEGEEAVGRVLLYVHGGAYYFGSVDTHRYQLQKYASKLGCRVVAPRYRLAPQFPFPCGIYDVLSVYLYLLSKQPAHTIILGGDSAGGGMVLAILTLLRDHYIDLPAGAVLVSPWVDLCHSFPSVIGDNSKDYIPPHGFLHRPSPAWPPPSTRDIEALKAGKPMPGTSTKEGEEGTITSTTEEAMGVESTTTGGATTDAGVKPARNTSITIDGVTHTITDQIQLYCPNPFLSHPLVSPIIAPSLGGLCPLLILSGGGEVLRDEQIYTAHKAAFPSQYPTWPGHLTTPAAIAAAAAHTTPTKVVLQVFANTCHVAPIMAWTRPARSMFRATRTFAHWAWASAALAATPDPDTPPPPQPYPFSRSPLFAIQLDALGRPSDFTAPAAVLAQPVDTIGVITPEPVKRWLHGKELWDARYAAEKRAVQQRQLAELAALPSDADEREDVPPSAAYNRRRTGGGDGVGGRGVTGLGLGVWIWGVWGGKDIKRGVGHEEKRVDRIERRRERMESVGRPGVGRRDSGGATVGGARRGRSVGRSSGDGEAAGGKEGEVD
ncbi:Alpha/Beta hydrolase protein [Geopyxis carbonaria]|nr:Alpha/Beta hydrolase protein [Geopyxis carbonaria]